MDDRDSFSPSVLSNQATRSAACKAGIKEARAGRPRLQHGRSREHAVFLEPGGHLAPRVISRLLAIAWPVVGMEAVGRAWIDLEFGGLAGGLEGRFHLLDLIDRNALVLGTLEAEHRLLDVLCRSDCVDRHRFVRRIGKAAVEGDARLEIAVGGIAPHGTAAAR